MGRSVRFAAYRAYSRRRNKAGVDTSVPRPNDRLIWIHAAEADRYLAVEDLGERMCLTMPPLSVLITLPDAASLDRAREAQPPGQSILLQNTPSDHPDTVGAFLRHWRPDLCLWAWGNLQPNLVVETAERGCPMVLFDADTGGFDTTRDRWVPELSRHLLGCFSHVLARRREAERRLEALGVPPDRLEGCTPLQPGGQALPCKDAQLSDLRSTLAGRPVWLAAGIQEEEVSTVLEAHRQAARLSHRLLLVIHPADAACALRCKERIAAAGLRLADWSAGADPEESTQVLVIDDARDLGLFYRVAPVSFMGSSLAAGTGGRNPFEAAALGSAVLYGPNVRRYLPFYTRLVNAGAARIVNDADTLGTAVTRLIAPDQSATMARAGWDVISEGAATTDRLMDLAESLLAGEDSPRDARA